MVLVGKLTVVVPPWALPCDRGGDPLWREKDDHYATLRIDTGPRSCFDVLNIQAAPGLERSNYADELQVIASGIPIYARLLVA
jgi:hypothetical protein